MTRIFALGVTIDLQGRVVAAVARADCGGTAL